MGCLETWLPAATRASLGLNLPLACRSICRPPSSGGGTPTTPMRRRSSSRAPASPLPAGSCRSLWPSACRSGGRARRRPRQPMARLAGPYAREIRCGRPSETGRRGARPLRARLSSSRRSGACAVLCADTFRQGRRSRRPDAADLAGQLHRPRHQGRELDADLGLARPVWPRVAVRSDQRATRRPTIRLLEVRRGEWEVRDVQNIADVLVDPEGALERRNHWEKTSHSLLVGAILHVLYAEADKTLAGVANFLSDPKRPIETTLRAMMTTAASRRRRAASGRRLRGARASEQERERALRRAVDRDVASSAFIAIPSWRRSHAMRLAHPRSCRGRAAGDALSGRAAVRHQPDQAAGAAHPQSDRPPADRGPACQGTAAPAAADARRVPGARPARLLRDPRWPSWRAMA